MGFVDNIKNIFFKGSVEVARTTPEKTSDIFQSTVKKKNIILISAITGNNINNLILQIIKLLNNEDE